VCPHIFDPDQADRDGDRVGDVCDPHVDQPIDYIALFDPFTSKLPIWTFYGAFTYTTYTGDAINVQAVGGNWSGIPALPPLTNDAFAMVAASRSSRFATRCTLSRRRPAADPAGSSFTPRKARFVHRRFRARPRRQHHGAREGRCPDAPCDRHQRRLKQRFRSSVRARYDQVDGRIGARVTQPTAAAQCVQWGGHLAWVLSPTEDSCLASIQMNDVWLGIDQVTGAPAPD